MSDEQKIDPVYQSFLQDAEAVSPIIENMPLNHVFALVAVGAQSLYSYFYHLNNPVPEDTGFVPVKEVFDGDSEGTGL